MGPPAMNMGNNHEQGSRDVGLEASCTVTIWDLSARVTAWKAGVGVFVYVLSVVGCRCVQKDPLE